MNGLNFHYRQACLCRVPCKQVRCGYVVCLTWEQDVSHVYYPHTHSSIMQQTVSCAHATYANLYTSTHTSTYTYTGYPPAPIAHDNVTPWLLPPPHQLYSTVPRHLLFMGRRGLKTAPGNDTLWVDSVYESNHGSPHMNPNLVDGVVSSSQVTSWLAKSSSTASAPLLGNALVIAAQIAAAAQFIIEEKFLTQYRVPALLAVGLEGFWGLLICLTIGPWLARVDLFHGRPFDNFSTALHEIAVSPMLLWSTVASIVSIAFFNSFGVRVTKRLSGAARAAIDACRTLFIWVIALGLGWEPLSPPLRITLQVLGFLVLLSGTSLYNELLRSCLPSPVLVSDATASLLGEEDGQGNGAGEGNGTRQRGSAAYAVRAPPIKENYSMARSMRVLPQVCCMVWGAYVVL